MRRISASIAAGFLVLAAVNADTSPRPPVFHPAKFGLHRTLVPRAGQILDCAFSPDGRLLAIAGQRDRVRLLSTRTWKTVQSLGAEQIGVQSLGFSPDGRLLAMLDNRGEAHLFDTAEWKERWKLPAPASGYTSRIRFSPDSRLVVFPAQGGGASVVEAANGKTITRLGSRTEPMFDGAFTRDGRALLLSSTAGQMELWNTTTWKEIRSWIAAPAGACPLAISADGRLAATGHSDGLVRLWALESGAELRTLKGHTGMLSSLAFTPDERHLISAGGLEVKVWETKGWTEAGSLIRHRLTVQGAVLSPDGAWIASVGRDQHLNLWASMPEGNRTSRPRAFLGVSIQDMGEQSRCAITEVRPGTAAERSGFKVGDVLFAIDGEPLEDYSEAVAMIGCHVAGDEVDFRLRRNGEELTLRAKLGKRPDED